MARRSTNGGPVAWWDRAYEGIDHIEPIYEMVHGKDTIAPGTPIRIKHQRGIFLFRCVAENVVTKSKWVDCLGPEKQWHSFRAERVKGIVRPKKFRRKTAR